MHGTSFDSMVHGAGTWVGVSDCHQGECGDAGNGVVVWASSDARSWSGTNLTPGNGDSSSRLLAAGATGYLLTIADDSRSPSPNELWVSADGRDWRRAALPDVGCVRELCPYPNGLAFAPSGALLVSFGAGREKESVGSYVSDDGVTWRRLKPSAFGVDALFVDSIESTESAVLLMGRPCWECEPLLWTSTDGATWDPIDDIPVERFSQPHLATGDERRVIVLTACSAVSCGGTDIWSSDDLGPWTRRFSDRDVSFAPVGFAGSGFVAVGVDEGSQDWVVLGSADGAAWGEVPNFSTTNPGDDDCVPEWLVGGARTVLLGGFLACAFWRGMVSAP